MAAPLTSSMLLLLGASDWIALLIVAFAAGWLVVRWKRKGLDDDEHGSCAGCPGSTSVKPGQPAEVSNEVGPRDAAAPDRRR